MRDIFRLVDNDLKVNVEVGQRNALSLQGVIFFLGEGKACVGDESLVALHFYL